MPQSALGFLCLGSVATVSDSLFGSGLVFRHAGLKCESVSWLNTALFIIIISSSSSSFMSVQ